MDELRLLLSPVLSQFRAVVKKNIGSYSSPKRYNQKAIGMRVLNVIIVDSLQDLYCLIDSLPELIDSIFWLCPERENDFGYLLNTLKGKRVADLQSSH